MHLVLKVFNPTIKEDAVTSVNIEFAKRLGGNFAAELNRQPQEAQNQSHPAAVDRP